MTETIARAAARCESCHRTYRVPRADRSYACKACGGTVHAVESLGPGAGPATTEPEEADPKEVRREAARTLQRAVWRMAWVTWLYRLGALAYGLATVAAILALSQTHVPTEGGVIVVGLTTLLTVLMAMAAIHLAFKPFVWTVIIAVLASGVTIVHAVGPDPLGLAMAGSGAWALVSWIAVIPTWTFRRLIAEHKDLYILHHASVATRRSLKGGTGAERHERLMGAMRRAARRAWKVSATAAVALVALSAFGTWRVLADLRPGELRPSMRTFESAWNASDMEELKGLLPEEVRTAEITWLAGAAEAFGWGAELPPISSGSAQQDDDEAVVEYFAGNVLLTTRWFLDGTRWRLSDLELPTPSLEPFVERFLAAWRESDLDGLVAFVSDEGRERMRTSLLASIDRRGWSTLPEIVEVEQDDPLPEGTQVTLRLPEGELITRWHLRNDAHWGLHRLELTRR